MKEINYSISFDKPFIHYCEVEISLNNLEEDSVIFSMPVWTPGSYMVREYAKNVDRVTAEVPGGKILSIEKINKNSWKVDSSGQSNICFRYRVYCNDHTVRTSEINSDHAFLSNAGIFMFVRGLEDKRCVLKIELPPEWKKISTGMEEESKNIYAAENYDVFIDSPIEIGNQKILEFEIRGIKHFICLYGKGNYNDEKLKNDFKTIAEEEIRLLGGDIPYKSYTYIIHLVEKGGGGLEHLNSFVVQMVRWNFTDEKLYKKFLGLVSHEFFHLWNVKRIRPAALGPFDYDKENHTKSLWVAEGWTSYYDNLILRRCGLIDNKEYFEFIDVEVNDVMRFEGRSNQSLAESSFDTWIKFYRKDENFSNSQVSYYTKGALVSMMLNIKIIISTNAEKSLDDALRMLYDDYKKDSTKGFSDERIKEVCQTVCGRSLDEFWEKYINGVAELPLGSYLADCGLELINENESAECSLDIESNTDNGKFIITKVHAGGTAYESGLNAKDEIIAINGMRTDQNSVKILLKDHSAGNVINVLISRDGLIREMEVKLLKSLPKFCIKESNSKTEQQIKFLEKWLKGI